MKHLLFLLAVPLGAACASQTVLEGHRALRFDPDTGLGHEVLPPGQYALHGGQHLEDFDVRMERRDERVRANTSDGRAFDTRVVVICRPIVDELYDLVSEEGHDYYDTIVKPELRSATRQVFGRETGPAVVVRGPSLDRAVLTELRARLHGKHVEVTDVIVEEVADAKVTL